MMVEDELLTPAEFARLRRTTVGTLAVERCEHRDHPTFIKLGRKILYRRSDVIAWLEAHRIAASNHDATLRSNPKKAHPNDPFAFGLSCSISAPVHGQLTDDHGQPRR
jgi:hypothetical protein